MSVQHVFESSTRPDTRSSIRELLLERGALTAVEIGHELGLTAAGVRRHLDHLVEAGEVEAVRSRPAGTRGRPAKAFQMTVSGRSTARHGYDHLAVEALTALRRIGGTAAVTEFARERVRSVIGHVRPAEGPHDVERAATDIATALSGAGYASSVEEAGTGLQICQHHCPVWNVASRFPELCAAEQEVVSEIVGTHVQRLATIAGGNCACTTNIPTGTVTVSDLAATIPAPADASASAPTAERTVR
ncbi:MULTISPECIES: helix-turn-helix transcriptional regulator [Dietzia]|jgi:predicted ArsR family transcriptional regulator|uniref:Transcriptional regulator n=1 Tax=Dietzia kunjamensis subsp. schimae TaxID=498198 RepID=A0ABY1MVS2_9ACTN|nr:MULTISPECIES: metalloregulator ArsR/SmtB family transcription factor [Dietzia]MBB1012134.1 transcriptional regulator [Dietzia kunjamensis]MBB1014364.1 transcriptional regulator [Dietzia kunjamensis subsp. schimae]MBB1018059.1 transcriptional regulator [Dietzia sp. DQ11-71]MCT1433948.1 transcriptional regulator [Dietzia maris]MCT1522556.1 transcriptional regulator [Dietzia maris]